MVAVDQSYAAIPAVDSRRRVLARMAGRRVVEMVNEDLRMSKILTKQAFENAISVNGAIGGSTNAVVHLLAIAGRVGVKLTLDDWDRLGRDMPCLVNLMPSGKYLMEDFYYAGGLPVVIREIGKYLHKKALTVTVRRPSAMRGSAAPWRCSCSRVRACTTRARDLSERSGALSTMRKRTP